MKKTIALVLICLLLAACGSEAPSSSLSVPLGPDPTLALPAAAVPLAESDYTEAQRAALMRAVDEVLAGYEGGFYPQEPVFNTENEMIHYVPGDCTLPVQATETDLWVETREDGMVTWAMYLLLPNNYFLCVWLGGRMSDDAADNQVESTSEELPAAAEVSVLYAYFMDGLPDMGADSVRLSGGEFTDLLVNRVRVSADFAGIILPGVTPILSGRVEWNLFDGLMMVYLSEPSGYYCFGVAGPESAYTLYPAEDDAGTDTTGMDAVTIGTMGRELLIALRSACAEVGIHQV